MENFNDLKDIWQQAKPRQTVEAEAKKLVLSYRKKQMVKNVSGIITLLITFCIVGYVGFSYPAQLAITRIGFACILLAIIGSVFFISGMIKTLFKEEGSMDDNKTYLVQLKRFQQKMTFIHSTGISIYFVLLSVGLALSMYEITRRNMVFAMIVYAITSAW